MNSSPTIRIATPDDTQGITDLYWRSLNSDKHLSETLQKIHSYPAVIAEIDGQLIGFAYTAEFAPDILELCNIFVHEGYRSHGIGRQIITHLEAIAADHYKGILLVNSDLYTHVAGKRPATNFYLNAGYSVIFQTDSTRGFFKRLS